MTAPAPGTAGSPDVRIDKPANAVEIAAVVAALDTIAARRSRTRTRPRTPAWSRAALREGLGGAPAAQPSDLATR